MLFPFTGGGKEDLFSYHDFDIDIPDLLDPVISSAAPAAAAAAPTVTPAKSALSSLASDKPVSSGPNKRSLNLSDYKKKRGLI